MLLFRRRKKPVENRYALRWKLDRFLSVYDKERQVFIGRVQDLSATGMCVASTEILLPIDQRVTLMLESTRDDGSMEAFAVNCRTMWVKPCGDVEDTGINLIGIEFFDLSLMAAALIDELVREQNLRQI
ncbi:MAG: PilZ domain-containing protein [Chromatiales bacterium]|nr:PilZ domain-containing protein [Chromatiales bacterium]